MNFLSLLQRNCSSVDLDFDLDVNVKSMKLELPDKTTSATCSKQGNIYYIDAKLDICPLCSSAES